MTHRFRATNYGKITDVTEEIKTFNFLKSKCLQRGYFYYYSFIYFINLSVISVISVYKVLVFNKLRRYR